MSADKNALVVVEVHADVQAGPSGAGGGGGMRKEFQPHDPLTPQFFLPAMQVRYFESSTE
jgi:hypothetical protein